MVTVKTVIAHLRAYLDNNEQTVLQDQMTIICRNSDKIKSIIVRPDLVISINYHNGVHCETTLRGLIDRAN